MGGAPGAQGESVSADGGEAAAREVALGRARLSAGGLGEAAGHLSHAMALAPDHLPLYAALGEFAAAAGSPAAAREYFKGDGKSVSAQNAAVIVALLAAEGDYDKALRFLGSVVATEPGLPWAGAAWFGPHLADKLPARTVAVAVGTIFDAVGYPGSPAARASLQPWLGLIRRAAARPDAGADVLRALSGAARRLDAAGDAVEFCERAAKLDRRAGVGTPESLIMLGYAHRDNGDPARAVEAWQAALKLAPGHLPLHFDLADLTFAQQDFAASRRWAERALALDGSSVKARGALLAATMRDTEPPMLRDGDAAAELFRLAAGNPDTPYLRALLAKACQGMSWVNVVPPPTEAVAMTAHYVDQPENRVVGVNRSHLSVLEVPSAMYGARQHGVEAEFSIGEVPEPDLRTPCTTQYGAPLWTYRGTEAVAAVPPASDAAVAVLHKVAQVLWPDPIGAYERAAPLGALSETDLLGLLAHVPAAGDFGRRLDGVNGLYWNRVAQAWVCVGILHHRVHEGPWPGSARRTLLLRLLHGPEDWTVDAAAFALCLAAWMQPQHSAEIVAEISARYRFAAQALGRRVSSLHGPLAAVLLACPGVDPQLVAEVESNLGIARREETSAEVERKKLRRWMGARGVRVV